MSPYLFLEISGELVFAGVAFIAVKWRSRFYLLVAGLVGLLARFVSGGSGLHLPLVWVWWAWLAVLLVLLAGVALWLKRSAEQGARVRANDAEAAAVK